MKIVVFIIRSAFALFFLAYGINFFYHLKFIPVIAINTKAANDIQNHLLKTGYFFEMLYGIEIACGFFLLINRFTPLFLLVLLPITINIFLFNYFLDPDNWDIFAYVLGVNLLLMLIYRKAYSHLFYSKAQFMNFHLLINFTE
ncbi:MAG: DoxX family rane protein [Mucilaginibacter sp.]|nr:DoxX family rane protein [Mucilaginibacter sp.]